MKNKKAIRLLQHIDYYLRTHTNESCEEEHTALTLAIKALENPSGDCISRELLKKDIEAQISDFNELNKKGEPYKDFKDIRAILFGLVIGKNLIDNAPPVEVFTLEDMQNNYDLGAMHENGKHDRPQGKWKTVDGYDGDEYYECSNCGEPWVLYAGTPEENNMNFCPNCGADLRKGGAE